MLNRVAAPVLNGPPPANAPAVRVGVVCDFVEENWPSMDLVADMFLEHLQQDHASYLPSRLCPRMIRHFGVVPWARRNRTAYNADRLVNRFWHYPRWLRGRVDDFDLFHVIDHSYSQLLHLLPPERTLVSCHDLEAFRCTLDTKNSGRSPMHRILARRTLTGFQKAAQVTCDSESIKKELLSYDLISPARVTVVANGVHPACSPKAEPIADFEAQQLLGAQDGAPELLNVGTAVDRKRIDILLKVFAEVRRQVPRARLIRAGGNFTAAQSTLIERLQIQDAVVVLPFMTRSVLAAVYRRAALVLQTSDYEGFGLPVAEAMACGTVVVASDIPVFREVGGDAISYCPNSRLITWSDTVVELLRERRDDFHLWDARRKGSVARASRFTWNIYVSKIISLYQRILNS